MAWVVYPGNLIFPPVFSVLANSKIYYGVGIDKNLFCFTSLLFNGQWVIYRTIGHDYLITRDGYTGILTLMSDPYNYESWWYGLYCLIKSNSGWVLANSTGYEPYEFSRTEGGVTVWYGNSWYSLDSETDLSTTINGIKTFIPRGNLKNSNPSPIKLQIYHYPDQLWIKYGGGKSHLGVYYRQDNPGNISFAKVVGVPLFKDDSGKEYLRSFKKNNDGKYIYGDIHFDENNQKWIIGTIGDEEGWWEGEEPQFFESITFYFTVNNGAEIKKSNIIISFDECIDIDYEETGYVFEANIWR